MSKEVYKKLAERLDALPNGFPPTEDGVELEMLARLFTPEEAELASQLRLTKETPEQVANRLGRDKAEVRTLLKGMVRRGLIAAGRTEVRFVTVCGRYLRKPGWQHRQRICDFVRVILQTILCKGHDHAAPIPSRDSSQ